MPKYRNGVRPDIDHLIALCEPKGGIFSAQEAEQAGISRQMLAYYSRTGKVKRLAYGVYKASVVSERITDDLVAAMAAVGPTAAAAGSTALDLMGVGHLVSDRYFITEEKGGDPTPASRRALSQLGTAVQIVERDRAKSQIRMWDGIPVEDVPQAIETARASGLWDPDQLGDVERDARRKGFIK